MSTYPRRLKAEALVNVVDVVERLRDPTDPSTERTAPPHSAYVQLDDVPRALDPVEDDGEFRLKEICPRGNNKVVIYISLYHDKCLLFMPELY